MPRDGSGDNYSFVPRHLSFVLVIGGGGERAWGSQYGPRSEPYVLSRADAGMIGGLILVGRHASA